MFRKQILVTKPRALQQPRDWLECLARVDESGVMDLAASQTLEVSSLYTQLVREDELFVIVVMTTMIIVMR